MTYLIDEKEKYKCSRCGRDNVKLWRQYNTMACYLNLKCAICAAPDTTVDEEGKSEQAFSRYDLPGRKSDQLDTEEDGALVPAIPTADGTDTFWGYSSVPIDGIIWWKALPTYEGQKFDFKKIVFKELDKSMDRYSRYWDKSLHKAIDNKSVEDNVLDICVKEANEDDYMTKLFTESMVILLKQIPHDQRMEWLETQ